jgi:hypothetical protein
MEDIDGNGDGECGKGMDWMGKPGSGCCDATTPKAAEVAPVTASPP